MSEKEPIPKPTKSPWPPVPLAPESESTSGVQGYWRWPSARDSTTLIPRTRSIDLYVQTPWANQSLRERFRTVWDAVERELLGRTAVSFIRRATEQGWAPDEASAYCHRCAESLGPYEGAREPGCPGCRSARLPWERALRLGTYHTLLRRAIHELKFTRWRRVGMELGALLGAMIASEIDAAGESRQGVAIVPIPSSYRRRLVRGIDHTQVLVQAIARTTGLQIVHALSRRHGPSQVSVPQSERTANVRDAFVHKGTIPSGIRVLIVVDDVRTTGATLTAATKALRTLLRTPGRENVRLWTAVVAVTPSPVSGRRNPVWSSGPI